MQSPVHPGPIPRLAHLTLSSLMISFLCSAHWYRPTKWAQSTAGNPVGPLDDTDTEETTPTPGPWRADKQVLSTLWETTQQ